MAFVDVFHDGEKVARVTFDEALTDQEALAKALKLTTDNEDGDPWFCDYDNPELEIQYIYRRGGRNTEVGDEAIVIRGETETSYFLTDQRLSFVDLLTLLNDGGE